MEGSTSASAVLHLKRQRVLWQEDQEPDASSEERGPTPALLPAQPPTHTGEDGVEKIHVFYTL